MHLHAYLKNLFICRCAQCSFLINLIFPLIPANSDWNLYHFDIPDSFGILTDTISYAKSINFEFLNFSSGACEISRDFHRSLRWAENCHRKYFTSNKSLHLSAFSTSYILFSFILYFSPWNYWFRKIRRNVIFGPPWPENARECFAPRPDRQSPNSTTAPTGLVPYWKRWAMISSRCWATVRTGRSLRIWCSYWWDVTFIVIEWPLLIWSSGTDVLRQANANCQMFASLLNCQN